MWIRSLTGGYLNIAGQFHSKKSLNKPVIFCALFLTFIAYSFVVYTYGTKLNLHPANDRAISGKLLFQKHNCIACQQIYGLGGYLGADLTTVISAQGKGETYTKAFIKYGTPRMPDFRFSDEEVESIIEYLKDIDQSAITYKHKQQIIYERES
jgi:nitric oxide reductase subunit C